MDNRAYYDTFATTYENRRDQGYHRFLDDAELSLVARHAEGRDVLEVGCGTGLILARLARIAHRAVGADLSPGMLQLARDRGLEVVEANATDLPFEDATFDVACSFKTLAHVEGIEKALGELARVTRPGGVVVAEFYNANSVRALVKRLGPAGRIGRKSARVKESDVFTRFDSVADLRAKLPPGLELERIDGIRVLSPSARLFELPVLGPVWTSLERAAMRTPLRRLGGFLVLTMRRK